MVSEERVPPFDAPLHEATLLLRDLMLTRGELERLHADALEVNSVDYRAMGMLLGQGPVSPSDLAAELGLSPSATSNVIDRLLAAGHVERHRATEDGRRMVISAVAASRERALAGVRPIIEQSETLLQTLTTEEQQAVIAYLSGMRQVLRDTVARLTEERSVPR